MTDPVEAQAVPDQPVAINYALLQDYQQKHRLDFNELCRVVNEAVTLVAASPAAAAGVPTVTDEMLNEAVRAYVQAGKRGCDLAGAMRCAIAAAVSPVAPVGAPTLSDEQIDGVIADVFGQGYRVLPRLRALHRKFARALLSAQGCELATDATKPKP